MEFVYISKSGKSYSYKKTVLYNKKIALNDAIEQGYIQNKSKWALKDFVKKKIKKIMATIIKNCTCECKFQDEMYGKSNRVYNLLGETTKGRCTVCGKEQ